MSHHNGNPSNWSQYSTATALLLSCSGLLILWHWHYWRLPHLWKVYIPPDLSRPQTVAPGRFPQLCVCVCQNCDGNAQFLPEDCAKDYAANLETLRLPPHPVVFQELAMHRERNMAFISIAPGCCPWVRRSLIRRKSPGSVKRLGSARGIPAGRAWWVSRPGATASTIRSGLSICRCRSNSAPISWRLIVISAPAPPGRWPHLGVRL